jgi:hypothetical protein
MAVQGRPAAVAAALACAAALSASGTAAAAARPTIHSAPNPTTAGDPVVVYGRAAAGARVVLWHRITPARSFTRISTTTAGAAGRYQFARLGGVVDSNRHWFVRADGRRSRTVHQRVLALVTVRGPASAGVVTGTPQIFSGTVSPARAGGRVVLQRQRSAGRGDDWHVIDRARIRAGGAYAIVHRFRHPGDANLRVVFRGDRRNVRSPSDVLSLQIQQKQNPALTLRASADPLDVGQSVALTGALAGVTAPQPVTLYARTARTGFAPVAQAMTDASGGYAFAQTPVVNSFYRVLAGGRHSAVLFLGVRSVVTATVDRTTVPAGTTLEFSGRVSPDKTGHVIALQRRNASGDDWHPVARGVVGAGSTFTLRRRVVDPGSKVFRILIPGGPDNQRGVSAPLTVTVTPSPAPLA